MRGASADPPAPAPLDPELLFKVMQRHSVHFVLIGALAARMYGFPRVTADADITPASDSANLERLAAALRELHARIYTEAIPEGLAFDCSAPMLQRTDLWNLTTDAGRVDISFKPAGTDGFDDLNKNAAHFEVFGVDLAVATLEDIIRSKKAADRPKDRSDVLILRAMLDNSN